MRDAATRVAADEEKITALFERLDTDHNGNVSFNELFVGVENDEELCERVFGESPLGADASAVGAGAARLRK